MPEVVEVARPQGQAQQLFLLFHGVGADAASLVPLGRRLAKSFPQAAVLSVRAPFPFDAGAQGRQWFSVRGVTDENRPARVAPAMPRFVAAVSELQQAQGVAPPATTLVGFSQGAIMALESARLGHALAGRIVSLAGRFAAAPEHRPAPATVHLLHGEDDPVIPAGQALLAAQQLSALGADVTVDVLPATGHGISDRMEEVLIERLERSMRG